MPPTYIKDDSRDSDLQQRVRCAAIGEGNLLQSCLKKLKSADFNIVAVFSNTDTVADFCEEHEILIKKRGACLEDVLSEMPVDYLFSISNPRIIKENVLNLPRIMTINYHDSPLPAYAGVHATSWAIINGETTHGISWHVVESGIDTGDILQFHKVDILPSDSALTVNLKCQEEASLAFSILINNIKNGTLSGKPQPSSGRSYYGLHAIPPNLGVLNFHNDTKSIYNSARALEFGNHDNALGSPKIKTITDEYFLVTNVEVSTKKNYEKAVAGTILDIVDDSLVVSTMGDSLIVSVALLDGTNLPQSNYKKHGLYVGARLQTTEFETKKLECIKRKEYFWRKNLHAYEPTVFFRQRLNVVARIIDVSDCIHLETVKLSFQNINIPELLMCDYDFLSSAFVTFLGRACCTSTVCLGLLAQKDYIPHDARPLYSGICPAVFQLDIEGSAIDVLSKVRDELFKYQNSKTFLIDLFYRYPELRGRKQTPHHNIVIGRESQIDVNTHDRDAVLHDCNLLIIFSEACNEIRLLYNRRPAEDFSHVVDVLKYFPVFLKSLTQLRTSRLCDIQMVPRAEMGTLYPPLKAEDSDLKINDALQKCCNQFSDNVALKTTQLSITYKKMMHEIEAVIDYLQFVIGKRQKQVIGIHLPNSISYVLSVLATLKSNYVFLPLPLDYPKERITFTMKDSNIHTLITTRELFESSNFEILSGNNKPFCLKMVDNLELLFTQIDFQKNDKYQDVQLHDTIADDKFKDVAYIMYTSGSTGRPKGVKVTDSGVVNLAQAQIKLWNLNQQDVIAQFASIGFDATISEIFTALFSGATLAILTKNERLGQEFTDALNKLEVNTITLPPSLLNIYGPNDLPKLKKIVSAGEACTLGTAVKWTTGTDVKFFNAYGPTETTVCATCFQFIPGLTHDDVNCELPIGQSIPGACVYLFDGFMHPVPPDVIGEIYIGGKGLSTGYHGHADHFNESKFVQNPLTNERMLLYRTGDHGYQDTDGVITYVGRLDDMVKIRGQRVDLSEIEQIIIQHPKIELSVVVVHKCSKTNEPSIAAYVAPSFVFISELREYLTKVLPKYMLPTFIKKLEVTDFPMTLNGKIDRKQLERDESVHELLSAVGSSHLNDIQLTVAKLWCKVLNMDENNSYSFHRQSSFAELGGNSLQLVLLQRSLEDNLDLSLSFTDIGTADTIEEFSEIVKRKRDVLRKSETNQTQDEDELRKLMMSDAELGNQILPHFARRGSIQFSHFSTFSKKCNGRRPKNILISGVTGFLGAYLLSELLEQTTAHICCMVRETTEARGLGRIIENMRRYDLWKFEYSPRIAIVISDLSQPRLGIAPDIYNSLCSSIDAIFMNAAMMNFNTSYEDHRVANVGSTKEFIIFAMTGVQKHIFTTSSLGVFLFPNTPLPCEPQNKVLNESDFFDDPCLIAGGYGQSKWVSEKLILQALEHLPGGAIFRPARISGCTINGYAPNNDLFASTLIGMKKLGAYPDMNFPYDLTPVDFVAKAMIEISLKIFSNGNCPKKVFHLFNHQTIPFCRLFEGMGLKGLPLERWRELLRNAPNHNKELIPLTPFFMSKFWDKSPYWPIFDTTNTNSMISDETKKLLLPSPDLLKTYKIFFDV